MFAKVTMFDVIGDVHGHADELVSLLREMGYAQINGAYRHSQRQAVFVGDFIDRGPQIAETLRIVRSMVDCGAAYAVMGNHELNALAFHIQDRNSPQDFLRPHSDKNVKQHLQTLLQLTAAELVDALEWFRTLPFFLDLDGVRVVHACWDPQGITALRRVRPGCERIDDTLLYDCVRRGSELFQATDHVLKGPEIHLPSGQTSRDKEGHERNTMRVRWFGGPYSTYQDIAMPYSSEVTIERLTDGFQPPVECYPIDSVPVFFGHYWLRVGETGATCIGPNVACVDFSVANSGHLAAYRWQGEQILRSDSFVLIQSRS
jgi:hypothetical protein